MMKALLCQTEHINHPEWGGLEIKLWKEGEKTQSRLRTFSEQAGISHGRQKKEMQRRLFDVAFFFPLQQ